MSLPPPDQALVGQILEGRYQIEALLGHGGMGAVYRGVHVHLGDRVAIKVLRPHLAGDAVAARRFAREARGTFKLETEHAVKVSDFGVTETGLLYMVMEHLDGRTVGDELEVDGAFAPARAVRIAVQICSALAAAHRLNFVHRDLKPDNVMLVRRGADPDFVKVLDFGLAKLIEGAGGAPFSVAALTQRDMVFGTPEYMAPEQAMGQALDGRADVYALGATLFELLTGRPPFVDTSPMKLLAQHVKNAPPMLREVRPSLDVPYQLEALVHRCLAKKPEARPASAEGLAAELLALVPTLSAVAPRVPVALASSETVDVDAVAPASAPSTNAVTRAVAPASPARVAGPPPSAGTEMLATQGLRRSTRVTIAAVVVAVAVLGAVVVVAMTREPEREQSGDRTSRSGSVSASMRDAAVVMAVTAPMDAAVAPTVVDARVVDARVAEEVRSGTSPGKIDKPEVDPALAKHLAAAEAARRSGNRLRQLAEADAALGRDPRQTRARFLMGEALLETGDTANGCKYLRMAKRLRDARKLLDAGRCPAD